MTFAQQLETILSLVAETGDRCIILQENRDPFVVMDIRQYQRLLKAAAGKEKISGMSESELLDKINQDIAEWRESRKEELSDYDLAQFRVDSPARQPSFSLPKRNLEGPVAKQEPRKSGGISVNLPIVADEGQDEYHLEPLA